MRLRRLIVGFLWRFLLGYGLLILPWPGFDELYARYFRAVGQMVFAYDEGAAHLYFEAVPTAQYRGLDTRIALVNRALLDRTGHGPVRYLELDTRGVGWVPTALILALILASPVPGRRKFRSLLWGLLAVHAFILFSLSAYIWDNLPEMALAVLTPFWRQVADGLTETLITQLGTSFVVPVLLWILVTFRREDLLAWTDGGEGPSDGTGRGQA